MSDYREDSDIYGNNSRVDGQVVLVDPMDPATKIPVDYMSALDTQVGGDHYVNRKIQPIEYSHANNLGPCESSIVKYVTRWKDKGGLLDLQKIKQYVDILIELEGLEEK